VAIDIAPLPFTRKRKQINREAQSAARSAAGGSTAGMMRNFNDESAGLKVYAYFM
jgi:protein transport protein SEC61 subunit beta